MLTRLEAKAFGPDAASDGVAAWGVNLTRAALDAVDEVSVVQRREATRKFGGTPTTRRVHVGPG